MKIDLQIQTTFSDGHDTPTEIIKMAKKAGVQYLAITDHDTMDGVDEALLAAKGTDIKVLAGAELSATFQGKRFHVLAYNLDKNNPQLNNFFQEIRSQFKEFFVETLLPWINERLTSDGKQTASKDAYEKMPYKYFRGPGLGFFLQEQGILKHMSEIFPYLEGCPRIILKRSVQEVIEIIHAAGGLAVLSHPLGKGTSLKEISQDPVAQEKTLKQFVGWGLDGLECYNPAHTPEDNRRIKKWAQQFQIHITAGSDWHGSIAKSGNRRAKLLPSYFDDFGGLRVPEEDAKSMVEWLYK
jgi:predicted metal-dependent phosphoesterase TrpH